MIYIDYWVEGVVGGAYHKIQIVSCAILNNWISARFYEVSGNMGVYSTLWTSSKSTSGKQKLTKKIA